MEIINQYNILQSVKEIDRNTISIIFCEAEGLDWGKDAYQLTINGHHIADNIKMIKEFHLNSPTVILEELGELQFYHGYMDELGTWFSDFGLPFTAYSGKFVTKEQEDWDNQLLYSISDSVRTTAFQSTFPVVTTAINKLNGDVLKHRIQEAFSSVRIATLVHTAKKDYKKLSDETPNSWCGDLIDSISSRVRTTAFQAATEALFRNSIYKREKNRIEQYPIPPTVKVALNSLLDKIQSLEAETFYEVFVYGYQLP